MDWDEYQNRSVKVAILEPHSPEWQTVRSRLLAAGKPQTVAFMDYQAAQGKGWNVRGTVRVDHKLNQRSKRTEQRQKLGLRVIRGGRLGD
jgi:hypothetical protein